MEALTEDHRTDLYSLGVLFWTLLVGRGTMPFEGGPLELLHAIVQKRPMPVHEVRRDVPQVLALIIDKVCTALSAREAIDMRPSLILIPAQLLAKSPDTRYHSAYGLKVDLLHCQRLLLNSVTVATEQVSTEVGKLLSYVV